MKKKYRITVIGSGDRGGSYMDMLDKYYKEQVVMAGICDTLPDRQTKALKKFGFETEHADWQEIIRISKPDIVIIATPAYLHCDIAAFAMQHGCHVLTEKPFDLDIAKCFALREISQRTGKKLAIGLQYRNNHIHRSMKHMFDANVIGTNRMVFYNDMRMTRPKIAMHDARYGNGGPFVDMACHMFDLMRWFYGCDPVSVFCNWSKSAECRPLLDSIGNKAADTGAMNITFADGSIGVITMNWGLPKSVDGKFTAYAVGSEGLVDLFSINDHKCIEVKVAGGEVLTFNVTSEDEPEVENAEKTVFDYLIHDIENRGNSQASFEDGIVSLACSLAALKSGALGRPVTLSEIYAERPSVLEAMHP